VKNARAQTTTIVTGKTKTVGVIGWPIGHTLSPRIHNAAFAAAGLDYIYLPLPVRPADLAVAVAGLAAAGFVGLNVTVPHKIAIIPLLDRLDPGAERVGAVNTVVFAGGRSTGYNTDLPGFVNSLAAENVAIGGRRAVLLGAGGAARAVVWALLDAGAAAIAVGARDGAKAAAFAASFPAGAVIGLDWLSPAFAAALAAGDLIINCTPLGMVPRSGETPPLDWTLLAPRAVICDLIYAPPLTRFLAEAGRRGHKTVGGAGMLVEQGAEAFTLWTGRAASRAVMYAALAAALKEAEQN